MKKIVSRIILFVLFISTTLMYQNKINAEETENVKIYATTENGISYGCFFGKDLVIPILKDENGNIGYCLVSDKLPPEQSGTNYVLTNHPNTQVVCKEDIIAAKNIIAHGYPFNSPSALGVNSKDEAYYATQTAIWLYINNKSIWDGQDVFAGKEEYLGVENLVYKLLDVADDGYTDKEYDISATNTITAKADEKNLKANIKVTLTGYNSAKLSLGNNAPQSSKILDSTGKEITELNKSDTITFTTNKQDVKEDITVKLKIEGTGNKFNFYECTKEAYQPVLMITNEKKETNVNIRCTPENVEEETPKGSIVILKIDNNTSEPLKDAEFSYSKKNGEIIDTVRTNKDGKATIKNLDYGTYVIKETKAPKGYNKTDEVYNVKINEVEPKYTLIVTNEAEKIVNKPKLPQTGSTAMEYVFPFGILLVVIGIVVALVSSYRKKSKL